MRIVLSIVASLALVACGSEQSGTFETDEGEGTYTVDSEDGGATATITTEDGTASFRSGANVKADLPDGWSVYPGAEVLTATNIDGVEGKGALVTMQTSDSVDDLTGFYRKQAKAAGLKIEMELTVNDGKMIGGQSDDGKQFSLNVTPGEEGEGNTAQLMVSDNLVN